MSAPSTLDPDALHACIEAFERDLPGLHARHPGMFAFANPGALEKAGDNLFRNASNLSAEPSVDAKLRQGFLENSNVKPVLEITRMVEVSRAYEQTAKMMDSEAELARRTVERLGRVQ